VIVDPDRRNISCKLLVSFEICKSRPKEEVFTYVSVLKTPQKVIFRASYSAGRRLLLITDR
jgi:hypothetical protein